jgi:hypothetical protein
MKTKLRIVGIILASLMASGCATPYMVDRGRDVADIFTATVGLGAGAKVRVGPIAAGLALNMSMAGLQSGVLFPGTNEESAVYGADEALLVFCTEVGIDTPLTEERRKFYQGCHLLVALPTAPWNKPVYPPSYFTDINVMVGVGGTVKLGFNPGELLDFILGWTTLDIYGDDVETRRLKGKSNKPSQGMPRSARQP